MIRALYVSLKMNTREIIHHLMYDFDSKSTYATCVELLAHVDSAADLLKISETYNWDDGMTLPRAIIDHSVCDLGLALHMFEGAEGVVWLEGKDSPDLNVDYEWSIFCRDLSDRILQKKYVADQVEFRTEYGKVQVYKMTKKGIPSVFLDPLNRLS